MKILLADDEPEFRLAVVDAIKRRYPLAEVLEADNGADLLRYARDETYDVIIASHKMPSMDGLRTIGKVREIEHTVPIWVLSSTLGKNDVLGFGADECLLRSYDAIEAEVVEALEKYARTTRPAPT